MSAQIIAQLKALSLHGMAASLPEQLMAAESAQRVVRSTAYQMGVAKFPVHRDLAGFEFEQSGVDEALVRRLQSTEFTTGAHNAVFIGGRVRARRTWPRPLVLRLYKSMPNECASSARWSWSMHWSKRKRTAKPGSLPT